MEKKRNIYLCSSFSERKVSDLYLCELVDHYFTFDLKLKKPLEYTGGLQKFISARGVNTKIEDAANEITKHIRNADIVLAIIEEKNIPYTETMMEVGMAVALSKPVVIFDCCGFRIDIESADYDSLYIPSQSLLDDNNSRLRGNLRESPREIDGDPKDFGTRSDDPKDSETGFGDIPKRAGATIASNTIISNMPIYWSKNIIRTSSWPETKSALRKISVFISKMEDLSDSE